MSWLVDPKTRQPLAALPTDVDLLERYGPSRHPASEWIFEREDGIPVRMRWVECHCATHQAEIDAANATFRAKDAQ